MAKNKKSALGRGLDAILGDVEIAYTKEFESGANKDMVIDIEVSKIKPNPYQPRQNFDEEALKELSQSIQRHGLIQPIIVFEKDGEYVLIAGERRLRATKLLGDKTIKAIVADIESQNLRELALIENIQRENLNPIELANSYKELIDEYKITQDDLSDIIKKSRSQITNTLRLLNLTKETKEALNLGKISQGHAKVLVGLKSDDEIKILNTIIGQKLTVRDTENLVKRLKNSDKPKKKEFASEEFKSSIKNLKSSLDRYGKVSIKDKKVSIEFKETKQIQDLIDKIS
ncbi:ParB/RepB/Spo0J family partition protein [Campylobacter corcagiensis]|uniref:ParB/RepB/Spo0J family partition protein n=1 Tax=Campylobacter corcagiensis TaxID=1448857 RepID=A0A7M1LGJ9_9BACT|nr:ParB/RepB/Spo0J family partition protein [Campylobacter corcagiensis]QKF65252.1 chromosome partitioning protein [Campylobacter corcagiensis]QOQ86615.1 ParB/RepB/Spo0J family partition protein [Campylobacter corcagiensis]